MTHNYVLISFTPVPSFSFLVQTVRWWQTIAKSLINAESVPSLEKFLHFLLQFLITIIQKGLDIWTKAIIFFLTFQINVTIHLIIESTLGVFTFDSCSAASTFFHLREYWILYFWIFLQIMTGNWLTHSIFLLFAEIL